MIEADEFAKKLSKAQENNWGKKLTDPAQIARGIEEALASCVANCYLCDDHVNEIATALREYGEAMKAEGMKHAYQVTEEYRKSVTEAYADGYRRGVESMPRLDHHHGYDGCDCMAEARCGCKCHQGWK